MKYRTTEALIFFLFFMLSLSKVLSQDLGIPKDPITKDEHGNIIDMQSFGPLMITGDYTIKPVRDDAGNFLHFLITKSTQEEKTAFLQRKIDKLNSLKINDPLPTFLIEESSGDKFDSRSLDSFASIILFTINECPPCDYLNRITDDLMVEYRDIDNLVLIKFDLPDQSVTVSYQDSISTILVTQETVDTLIAHFKLISYPTLIISDIKGKIQHVTHGGRLSSKDTAIEAINSTSSKCRDLATGLL